MAFFRKALLASTMIAAGVASTTGAAFAQDDDGQDGDKNIVNAQGADTLNQLSACDINVDVLNVLPIDEVTANADIPILNKTGDGNDQGRVPNGQETCNPESKSGSVDSVDSDTDDTTAGTESTGLGN